MIYINNVTVKINMIKGDGEKHEIYIKGNLMSLESSTEHPYGTTIHRLEIVEREKDDTARNHLMPCQKALENIGKENKSMSVKIKKQPKEISLKELQKGNNYEEVIIHINEEKREEIENKYGVHYHYDSIIYLTDDEIKFKENYITIGFGNVPYEIISKIEVVEK